jgi:hypothetical protein
MDFEKMTTLELAEYMRRACEEKHDGANPEIRAEAERKHKAVTEYVAGLRREKKAVRHE